MPCANRPPPRMIALCVAAAVTAAAAVAGAGLEVEDESPVLMEANVGSWAAFNCHLDFPWGFKVPYILNFSKEERPVAWTGKDGVGTEPDLEGRVTVAETGPTRVTVNLTEIRETDAGMYECTLIIPNRTPSERRSGTQFHLTVHGSDLLGEMPKNLTVTDGEPAIFKCGSKRTEATVTWYKDGIPLKDTSLQSRSKISSRGDLTILRTDITDPGVYKCQVTAPDGDSQSAAAFLNVTYKARVVFTPRQAFLPHGKEALIECHVSANPPLSQPIKWKKDGLLFEPSNVKGVNRLKNGSLYFTKIDEADGGNYTCEGFNRLGSAGASLPIVVVVQHPPVFTVSPGLLYLKRVGDTVDMPCDAIDGDHRPNIAWFKKDQTPLPEDRIVRNEGNLTINNLKEEDRGLYECVAWNQAATITSQSELVIENSGPRGPHDLVGTASTHSVSLKWRPGYGAATHRYSIWMRLVGRNEWRSISVKGPHASVSSLEPATEYEFLVLSQDHSGEGMVSKPIQITTTGDPEEGSSGSSELKTAAFQEIGKPKNLRISLKSEGYALEWDEPEFGLDLLVYYMVLWDSEKSPGDSLHIMAETTHQSHVVGFLEEDTSNYFQVRAVTLNNHYSASDILVFYVPSTGGTLSYLLSALIGFFIAIVIVCIYTNRLYVRTRLESLNVPRG